MNIPPLTPPTDNLYKFVAISGLLAAVAVLILGMVQSDKLSERVEEHLSSQIMLRAEIDGLREDTEQLQKELDAQTGTARNRREGASQREFEKLPGTTDSLVETKRASLRDKRRELKRNETLLSAKDIALSAATQRMLIYSKLVGGYGGFALLCSVCGFGMWFFRLQRPQDQLLQAEVAAQMKKPEKTPSTLPPRGPDATSEQSGAQ